MKVIELNDGRFDVLVDHIKSWAEDPITIIVNDYNKGKLDQEAMESMVYLELQNAIETTLTADAVSSLSYSNDEYEEACNVISELTGVSLFGININELIGKARRNARSKFNNGNAFELLNSRTNKLLLDRVSEIKHYLPGMGFRFGIDKLDKHIGGVMPREILVLTGHQGSMKTSLVLSGVDNALSRHMTVLFFSLDMAPDVLQERRLMRYMGKSQAQLIQLSRLKDSEVDKAACNLAFQDDGCLIIEGNDYNGSGMKWNVYSIAEEVEKVRPHVLVIDFITRLRSGKQSDLECVNEAMDVLRGVTQKCGVRTILLSQMSRTAKLDQKIGNMGGHSKGGGEIEDAADYEIELFKDISEYSKNGRIIATVTKSRKAQDHTSFELGTDMSSMKFTGEAIEVRRLSKAAGKPVFGEAEETANCNTKFNSMTWFDKNDNKD